MVYSLRLVCAGMERERLIAELWERGTGGITELDDSVTAFFDESFDAAEWQEFFPEWTAVLSDNWSAASREGWDSFPVGERLFVVPEWSGEGAPDGRMRLVGHFGMASGSGYSDPTRLALEALDRYLHLGDTVLDVGAGSGILTSAAGLLGAGKRVACEIDVDAAMIAARNLGSGPLVYVGSPRSLVNRVADVVIANLNAVALESISKDLVRVGKPGCRLIISGFQVRDAPGVKDVFQQCGAALLGVLERGEWRCMIFRSAS